jgi:hypothetical protein
MSDGQGLFGLALIAGMALIGLWTAWMQGRVLAREPGDTPESLFFRSQAVRRMVIALLLVVMGAMLGVAMILLEEPAQALADMRDRADQAGTIFRLDDGQERFASIYGGFWLGFFFVFFMLLAVLAWDVWALRSFRLGLRRDILEHKRRLASNRGEGAG